MLLQRDAAQEQLQPSISQCSMTFIYVDEGPITSHTRGHAEYLNL